MKKWRLLVTPQLRGAMNMALDVAIAQTVAKNNSPPTLRFYDWRPRCLSLGHNQKASSIDFYRCKKLGLDIARRPTGGRAVLHAREFTYSVIFPLENSRLGKSIAETYFYLSEWLEDGLKKLGIRAGKAPKPSRYSKLKTPMDVSCFAIPLNNEIMVDGKKLVGSSQRRWPNVVLQHGSILIGPEHLEVVKTLGESTDSLNRMEAYLRDRTTCLQEHIASIPGLSEFAELMVECWQNRFETAIERADIAETELLLAESMKPDFDLLQNDLPSENYPRSFLSPTYSGIKA